MTWTSPMTAVAGAAFTAAQFNAHVRDNLLETAPAKATVAGSHFVGAGPNAIAERRTLQASVVTSQTTTSTSFNDLATTGPAVSITTGTDALVFVTCQMNNSTSNFSVAGYEVTGASSVTAEDERGVVQDSTSGNFEDMRATAVHLQGGLTAGSNTFTMKYRVGGGTGTFQRRVLTVMGF